MTQGRAITARVLLVTNNSRWEGTEAQIASVANAFNADSDFVLHAAVFRPGVLVDVLGQMGIAVRVVPVRWQFDFSAVVRLARLLRAWRIDVVHSHGYKANVIGALAARLAGIPAVVRTEHGLAEPFRGFRRLKMALYIGLDAVVGRRVTDGVIAVSDDVAVDARRRLPGVPVFRIHNGIDPECPPRVSKAEARRALGLPVGARVAGIIGRLVPVKDHRTFLAAAARVAREEAAAQFLIAGSGPLQAVLEAEATGLGIRERVHFRYLPGGAQAVLDALDVLVFSSRHEGIPYALLEGLRAEVPVVATAVGGLGESLTDGQDALLVPAQDPDAMAGAVLRLFGDPAMAGALGRQGRQTVLDRFSLGQMREGTAAAYLEALRFAAHRSRSVVRPFASKNSAASHQPPTIKSSWGANGGERRSGMSPDFRRTIEQSNHRTLLGLDEEPSNAVRSRRMTEQPKGVQGR